MKDDFRKTFIQPLKDGKETRSAKYLSIGQLQQTLKVYEKSQKKTNKPTKTKKKPRKQQEIVINETIIGSILVQNVLILLLLLMAFQEALQKFKILNLNPIVKYITLITNGVPRSIIEIQNPKFKSYCKIEKKYGAGKSQNHAIRIKIDSFLEYPKNQQTPLPQQLNNKERKYLEKQRINQ